jgi:hypothetical protein
VIRAYEGLCTVTYIELVELGQPNDSARVNTFLPLRSDKLYENLIAMTLTDQST